MTKDKAHILHALCKSIITDQPFLLLPLRVFQPIYALMYKPPQHLHSHQIRNCRVPRYLINKRLIVQKSSHHVHTRQRRW